MFVEGRRPICWSCKQLGHLARTCPQKTPSNNSNNNNNNNNNEKNTSSTINTTLESGNQQDNSENGWTQVTLILYYLSVFPRPKNNQLAIPLEITLERLKADGL